MGKPRLIDSSRLNIRFRSSWLFFRVARSTRMIQIWALYRQSGSDRLEKQPTDLRQNTSYFGDRTLGSADRDHESVNRFRLAGSLSWKIQMRFGSSDFQGNETRESVVRASSNTDQPVSSMAWKA
jgi:hypothetical protein